MQPVPDLIVFSHPACAAHEPPAGHPESPERLEAALRACDGWPVREAPRVESEALLRVHTCTHVDAIVASAPPPQARRFQIDPDTWMSPGSLEAAYRAAGAVVAAVDAVLDGQAKAAFCAVRPPGHHAEPDAAMGFCLFNSVAVAANHARAVHGLSRVVVVDFDVHHGNGSQSLAERDPGFLYASIHQSPCYPGTGAAQERASGNLLNVPVAPGATREAWRAAYEGILIPAVRAWKPQLILISAGFDAHRLDPLAGLNLEAADYGWATGLLCDIAPGRVVSALEGGYHLAALEACVREHLRALAGGWQQQGGSDARGAAHSG
jgi:acetoin utilization deacetylase AcuC-like enzyme